MNIKLKWTFILTAFGFIYGLVKAHNNGVIVIDENLGYAIGTAVLLLFAGLLVDFTIALLNRKKNAN